VPESRLVFGTAALGLPYGLGRDGRPPELMPEARAAALVTDARERGFAIFDTAPGYGVSEERMGRIVDGAATVWTKVGHDVKEDYGRVEGSVATSCERLRRPLLDLLQWHNFTAERGADARFRDAWKRLAAGGRVRALGATTYGPADARAAVESGLFTLVQVEWNVLNQRVVREVGELARARGVKLAVRSVLLQGVLSEAARDLPALPDLHRARARALDVARQHGLPLEEMAMRAALHHRLIDHVLVGIDTEGQAQAALELERKGPLPAALVDAIEALDLGGDPATDPRVWRR
jgi:aryl-alcohol dehydrogenase-like predicted oxidoreductase